jgi:hypothetical protein
MKHYRQTLIDAFTIVFFLICFWTIGIIMSWPEVHPVIPWAVEEPMGIWLEDPYQTKEKIRINELENQQAIDFFCAPHRNPFQQLVYKRETI